MNLYIAKGKAIIMIAMSFLLLASGLEVFSNMGNISITELDFQYILRYLMMFLINKFIVI